MVTLLLVVGLSLTAAPDRPSVVVVGLHSVDMPGKKVDAFAELFADALASSTPRLKVTSAEALASVLGLERQRELAGCSSDTNCLMEVVGALGPGAIVSGSVVKVGKQISVSVRALGGRDGRLLYGAQAMVSDEDGVLVWLKDQAARVGARILSELEPTTGVSRAPAIASTVVAGVAAASAVVFFILTSTEHRAFLDATSLGDAQALASTGRTFQVAAWSSAGLAVAAGIVASLFFTLPAGAPRVEVALSPSGGALLLRGSF